MDSAQVSEEHPPIRSGSTSAVPARRPWPRQVLREGVTIFGIWTLIALLSAGYTSLSRLQVNQTPEWGRSLVLNLVDWEILGVFTCIILWFVRRWPIGPRRWHLLPLYLGLISLLVGLKYVVYLPMRRFFYPVPGFSLSHAILESFFYEFFEMAAIVGVVHAVEYGRSVQESKLRAAQLESRLAVARLEVLRSELQPHFLFNALHAVSTMMHRDIDAADEMLSQLGDLLRFSLQNRNMQQGTLRDELAVLAPYLKIIRVRFGDRLSVVLDVDPKALDIQVPLFLLQPLVENAIHHGISRRGGKGQIAIRASVEEDVLRISVIDDGPGLSNERIEEGVGLSNTRLRIEQLYRGRGSLTLKPRSDAGTEAIVTVPCDRGESREQVA